MARTKAGDDNKYRCQLCWPGLRCNRSLCRYAHSLDELLPPNEQTVDLPAVWRDGVHRWYGQQVEAEALESIEAWYWRTPPRERPVWATGCLWFYFRLPSFVCIADLPYDFGVFQDLLVVKMNRASKGWPFQWAPGFCARIEERRVGVNSMNLSCVPMTPPVDDRGIVHTPPSSDPETLSAPCGISLQSKRYSSPSVPISSSSSDTEDRIAINLKTKTYAAAGDRPIDKEVSDDDIPGVAKVIRQVSSATALFESNERRIRALVQSCPPRKQVSKASIPDPSESSSESVSAHGTETIEYEGVPKSEPPKSLVVVSKEEPEVDHPRVNAKHGIDASSTVGTVHSSLGIDSFAFDSALSLHAAPPCSSSSGSIRSRSTISSSDRTSRSRSIRGKSPSPVSSQVDFGTD